jgi:hypothetical protein
MRLVSTDIKSRQLNFLDAFGFSFSMKLDPVHFEICPREKEERKKIHKRYTNSTLLPKKISSE